MVFFFTAFENFEKNDFIIFENQENGARLREAWKKMSEVENAKENAVKLIVGESPSPKHRSSYSV